MGLKVSIEGKEGTSIIVWINNERYFYNDFDFGLLSKLKKLLKPKPREAIKFLEDHSISYTRPDGQVINLKGSIIKTIKIKKKNLKKKVKMFGL